VRLVGTLISKIDIINLFNLRFIIFTLLFCTLCCTSCAMIRNKKDRELDYVKEMCSSNPIVGYMEGVRAEIEAKRKELESLGLDITTEKYRHLDQQISGYDTKWDRLNKDIELACRQWALCQYRIDDNLSDACKEQQDRMDKAQEKAREFFKEVQHLNIEVVVPDSNQLSQKREDLKPPKLTCPEDITIEAEGKLTPVLFKATAISADPNLVILYNPESGSEFPIGTTDVKVKATDSFGNSSICTFKVTVKGKALSVAYVWDFTTPNLQEDDLTRRITNEFNVALVNNARCFTVVDRRNHNQIKSHIKNEQMISHIDPNIVRFLQADALIVGTIDDDNTSGQVNITVEVKDFKSKILTAANTRLLKLEIYNPEIREKKMKELAANICEKICKEIAIDPPEKITFDFKAHEPPLPSNKKVRKVKFLPDSKAVAIIRDDSIEVIEIDSKNQTKYKYEKMDSKISSIDFSKGNDFVAVGFDNNSLHIYTQKGHLLKALPTKSSVTSVAFNNEGSLLAIGFRDGHIDLVDTGQWRIEGNLIGHENQVCSLGFKPNDKELVSVSLGDMQIKLWDLKVKKVLLTWVVEVDKPPGVGDRLCSTCFSADGSLMGLNIKQIYIDYLKNRRTDKRLLVVRETTTGREVNKFNLSEDISAIAFYNEKCVASASEDNKIILWDIYHKDNVYTYNRPPLEGTAISLDFSNDGKMLAYITYKEIVILNCNYKIKKG